MSGLPSTQNIQLISQKRTSKNTESESINRSQWQEWEHLMCQSWKSTRKYWNEIYFSSAFQFLKINMKRNLNPWWTAGKTTWQIHKGEFFFPWLWQSSNLKTTRIADKSLTLCVSVNGAVMTQCFSVSVVSQPTPKGPGLRDTKARINGALEKLMENH